MVHKYNLESQKRRKRKVFGLQIVPDWICAFLYDWIAIRISQIIWGCLVVLSKQHNTYFQNTFSPHVFSQYLNNIARITLPNGP